MLFLNMESEERIVFAVQGFTVGSSYYKSTRNKPKFEVYRSPTASGLMSCEETKCVFYSGNHKKKIALRQQNMTLQEKQ